MNPNLITIGNFSIEWYSVLILTGIIIAAFFVKREASSFGIPDSFVSNMFFWTIILSILGARLYYVLFNFEYYKINMVEILQIWKGGLAIHGGIIVGMLVVLVYCKKYKVKALRMFDIIVPFLLLAQAIGRWGNFFNSEAYGTATTLEALQHLKIIPNFVIEGMNIGGVYYMPTFYFESLWCILGFIVLLIVRSRKYTHIGQTAGLYFLWYSVGRFFIESMRLDSLMFGDFRVAQIASVVLGVIGLVMILAQARKPKLEDLYNDHTKLENVRF
jgi:phosphatidylglycerol:prolipoprotein diacylglycerol transferase